MNEGLVKLSGVTVVCDILLTGLNACNVEVLVGRVTDGNIVPLAVDCRVLKNRICYSCILAYCLECIFICLKIICAADFCRCAACSVVPVVAVVSPYF